jgi:hypothetical protein
MAEDLRKRWETWARRHLGPDEQRIQAATEAAVRAAQQGATSDEAAKAARAAAQAVVGDTALSSDSSLLVGPAQRVQHRTQLSEGRSLVFLTFRIPRPDGSMVSVEMRGLILTGTIADGDIIEVPTAHANHGVVTADRVYNRTIGSEVRMSRGVSGSWAMMKASQGKRLSVAQLGCLGLVLVLFATAIVSFVWILPAINAPSQPSDPGSVSVPDVVGKNNVAAARALTDAGLRATTDTETSADVPFGRVIRQDPPAGTVVPAESTVTLVLSTGPPF